MEVQIGDILDLALVLDSEHPVAEAEKRQSADAKYESWAVIIVTETESLIVPVVPEGKYGPELVPQPVHCLHVDPVLGTVGDPHVQTALLGWARWKSTHDLNVLKLGCDFGNTLLPGEAENLRDALVRHLGA